MPTPHPVDVADRVDAETTRGLACRELRLAVQRWECEGGAQPSHYTL